MKASMEMILYDYDSVLSIHVHVFVVIAQSDKSHVQNIAF